MAKEQVALMPQAELDEEMLAAMRAKIGARLRIEHSINNDYASRIAVACPFCYVMLDDGVKGEGKDEEVQVQDIAEILWEAIEHAGVPEPTPTSGS